MNRLFLIALLLLVSDQSVSASMRFGSRSIRDTVTNSNTVSTISQQSGCPDAANTGEVHFTDLAESFDCDGDEGFTFTQSSNLVNINEATDGDSVLLLLQNDQANASGSTNETAQLRFGFGSDTDVGRIISGKMRDFVLDSDAYLAFNTDIQGVSTEIFRAGGKASTQEGVAIGLTGFTRGDLAVSGCEASSTDTCFWIGNDASGVEYMKVQTGAKVTIGDNINGSEAKLTLTSNTSSGIVITSSGLGDVPAILSFQTTSSPTYTNSLALDDVNTPTNQRYMSWMATDESDVGNENPFIVFNGVLSLTGGQVLTLADGVTIGNQRHFIFQAPTINGIAGGSTETVTNAATVYIKSAPSGSNITFTNGPYALWVDDGAVRFDGTILATSSVTNQGDITIQKADPSLIYDVVTATDTDFWAGVQDDAGGDDDDTYQIGKGTTPGTTPRFTMTGAGAISLVDKLTTYNNIATVGNGIPSELATIDTTGLTANVGASTLYVVPSTGEGLYRVSAYLVTTTAASISSTMPNAQVVYTDKDSNTPVTLDVSPILGAAGLGQSGLLTANTVGTVFCGVVVIYVKASTTIQYQTINYASSLAGMTYALHILLEKM